MKYKKLVVIEWEDPTWVSEESLESEFNLMKQYTAGFLVKENKKYIRVAMNYDEDNIGEFTDIPKSLIKKIRWIKI